MMRRLIVAAALAACASSATAADWVPLLKAKDGSSWSYDQATIQRSGTVVSVWLEGDVAGVKGEDAAEIKVMMKYNCADRTKFQRSVIAYNANGSVIDSHNRYEAEVSYTPVVPDTIDESVVGLLCR